ncbi:glycosyltransferase family 2 protein [Streptococcus caprae]|uniref:Glycosyltransferase family 2 protein n=1 Tax=Streptococcus caprae TaxID=1640501 RepID=A0ABV8CTZ3_9STRE
MTNKKDITYIIVTWNSSDEIITCLDSIKQFSPSNFKVIVVDNCSSDKTAELISNVYPEVKVIASEENLGFAKGNNLALEFVDTEYLCYLNPDVILTEDIVTPSLDKLETDLEIGLVACHLKNPDGSHQASCFNFANSRSLFTEILHVGAFLPKGLRKKFFPNHYQAEKPYYPDWVIGAEMIMRTSEAKQIEGFSTEYFMYTEDMDLCKKIDVILHKKVLYLPHISLIHIGGASEAKNINYNKQKKLFENTFIFVDKFYSKTESQKTHQNMILAYQIRLALLKLLYHKSDREQQINKTFQSLQILQEIN